MQRKLDNKPSSVAWRGVVWRAAAAVWRRTELFGPEQWRHRAESDALHWVYSIVYSSRAVSLETTFYGHRAVLLAAAAAAAALVSLPTRRAIVAIL